MRHHSQRLEVECAGESVEDRWGRVSLAPLLESGVVVDADPGEHGDFFTAKTGNPPPRPRGDADIRGLHVAASRFEEGSQFGGAHETTLASPRRG